MQNFIDNFPYSFKYSKSNAFYQIQLKILILLQIFGFTFEKFKMSQLEFDRFCIYLNYQIIMYVGKYLDSIDNN